MENQGMQRRPHVVLVPAPLQGHLSPMLELGTLLHSKGFSIIIAHTIFNSPDPCNHPEFSFLPIPDNLGDQTAAAANLMTLIITMNNNCEAPLTEILAEFMKRNDQHDQICCIIYDMIMYVSGAVADKLQLPCMILRTSAASAAAAYEHLPRLNAEGYFPLQDSKLQDLVPGLHPLRLKDFATADMGNIKDIIEISAITNNTRNASALIWNTVDHLEHTALALVQQAYPVKFFPIGPIHKMAPPSSTSLLQADSNCMAWLDKQAPHSVIYVSIGSIAIMEEKELAEIAWGLANSSQPFLWVVRPGSVRGSEWIELLPEGFKETVGERGCIVKWTPQRKVLAHVAVGGFWSHCGWNSALESISEGVPMICRPCFADQNINARYLSEFWKVGLHMDGQLDRVKIATTIKRLIMDKEGLEIRQNANAMKEKTKLSVAKGGSSYSSLNELAKLILSNQLPK
ncbi:UDP-glucose iridoid glucosyltransferase-like [Apium graveolens]|uniref:UDP-glucose iridoid glucosyltransferase-like n=1 Tax=Apium graveolens TaxID=4045 RepID=UPI003D7AE6B5